MTVSEIIKESNPLCKVFEFIGVIWFCGIISAKLSGNQQVGLLVVLILALTPILYFFTHTFFSGILIYTKRMKAINALKTSHKMVNKNLKLCAWYSIVYLFQTLLDTLLFIIPLFWILPKFAIAYGILFERLSEKEFPTTERNWYCFSIITALKLNSVNKKTRKSFRNYGS